jgi:hypothetical protein
LHQRSPEHLCERFRVLAIREQSSCDIALAFTSAMPTMVRHAAKEAVHHIESLTETAERHDDLNSMRKIARKRLFALEALVTHRIWVGLARHNGLGRARSIYNSFI